MVRAVLKALLPKATFATVETVVPLRQLPQASDLNAAAAWGGVVGLEGTPQCRHDQSRANTSSSSFCTRSK
jgi:hypothetical protein